MKIQIKWFNREEPFRFELAIRGTKEEVKTFAWAFPDLLEEALDAALKEEGAKMAQRLTRRGWSV